MKLTRNSIRKFIQEEIKNLVDEDALLDPPKLGDPHYVDFDSQENYVDNEPNICPKCRKAMMHPMKKAVTLRVHSMLDEACACHGARQKGMDDYSLDSMSMVPMQSIGMMSNLGKHGGKSHKGSSYMAKPQLAKIAKYATLLHSMIADGEELQDWQESHIAQIADDIGEVFHSIEYKKSNF